MDFFKKVIGYFKAHIFEIIVIFSFIYFLRSLSHAGTLLFVDSVGAVVIPITLVALAIAVLQFYSLFMLKKYSWVFSALQVLLIFFTSIGSFGYVFEVIFRSWILDRQTYAYLVMGWLFASEIFKTYWLYKNLR
jgi:hypothetical protein